MLALWRRQAALDRYPTGVLRVPVPIPGTAFFPGGYGLWNSAAGQPLPTFPVGGIMVLGHDFHSESGYRASIARGRESASQPTWRNLVDVFGRAGVPLEGCFFTNYFMGLRAGDATTGPFPGAKDAEFVSYCQAFLVEQLRAQRPRLVITLGVHTPPGVAALSRDLRDWGTGRGLRHLDSVGALRTGARIDDVPGFSTAFVALTHPSLRHASVRHRRYMDLAGDAAEVALLRDAVRVALSG